MVIEKTLPSWCIGFWIKDFGLQDEETTIFKGFSLNQILFN
jgi:phage-related tail fiber protein